MQTYLWGLGNGLEWGSGHGWGLWWRHVPVHELGMGLGEVGRLVELGVLSLRVCDSSVPEYL